MVDHVNNAGNMQDLMPILNKCFDLNALKHIINERISTLNEKEINPIYYNSMPLDYVLPTDVLQHTLSFNHLEDIETVSKTFKQCMDKNKNLFPQEEYLNINVDKIESFEESIKLLTYVRKTKMDLMTKYDEIMIQHKKEFKKRSTEIEVLRQKLYAMVNKNIYPLQTQILDKQINALCAKMRSLTPSINEKNSLIHCMGCGKIYDSEWFDSSCGCGKMYCVDCRCQLYLPRSTKQRHQGNFGCIDCGEFEYNSVHQDRDDLRFYLGYYDPSRTFMPNHRPQ